MNKKASIRTERDNGKWFITRTNERGVVTRIREYRTRGEARDAMRTLKRATVIVAVPHHEFNNVQ